MDVHANPRAFSLSIVLLVGGFAAGLVGCGYAPGYRAPPGVESIAIPIFDNETFPLRREVEYELTSAVRRAILSRTPLRLVDSNDADMTILGTIREYREPVVAEGARDRKTESSVVIDVAIVVEDYRNGRRREERIRTYEPFSIQSGESVDGARARAVDNLAERILLVAESWEDAP